jgi:iron only hydrogenase large subunit-like protein
MEGAVLKTYYAKKMGIDPKDIFVCSIMPCTVKKYESDRGELSEDNIPDVDAVITTRELVRFFKMAGIDFNDLPMDNFDNPLGESTGAAAIFGTSGGVMEAALRTAYYKLSGKNIDKLEFEEIRGMKGVKEATVEIDGMKLNIAVVNGIGNVKEIVEDVKNGNSKYHFIEVMACPGGCINGGGQPIHQRQDKVLRRMKALYQIDEKSKSRNSHENESVKALYKEYFIEPNSHKAHSILHTEYFDRKRKFSKN